MQRNIFTSIAKEDYDDSIYTESRPRGLIVSSIISCAVGGLAIGTSLTHAGFAELGTVGYVGFSNLDNVSYIFQALGERKKISNPKRFLNMRKIAGGIIMAAQLTIMTGSAVSLCEDHFPKVNQEEVWLTGASVATNAAIWKVLVNDSKHGTAHRDGWRHASIDTSGNLSAFFVLMYAVPAYAAANSITAIAIPAATIAATAMTKGRLMSDRYLQEPPGPDHNPPNVVTDVSRPE